jgi:undecaprenyl-phosphate 4-deoxy-4-formamido-L-arabinose transferase
MGTNTLLDYIFTPKEYPTDYETLTSVIAFFRGFQLLAISVVGEYVGRIYLALNSDPQFILREKVSARKKPAVVSSCREAERDDRENSANAT